MSALSGTAPSPPVQLTRFIGREREIAEVRQLLETRRLVTLTGAGGSGKTRLAVEVAEQVAVDTAWVDLTPLLDPTLAPEHVATSIGVRLEGSEPAEAVLLRALRDRSLLLVLDNCEHLLPAVAHLGEALLQGCRGLRILATSREALGVQGEVAWLLPPLSLPPGGSDAAGALGASEAVALFVARAGDVAPSFELDDTNVAAVVEICRRLDGLPLAIELAAARVSVLAPAQIAARLDDRFRLLTSRSPTTPSRHRTLAEVITWSYDLLTAPERTMLQRLSAFVGDFSLTAAEAVAAGGGIEARDVLDLVGSLVGKSLVVTEGGRNQVRYRLLETVQQFARERLRERENAEGVRRRHAEFFLSEALAREDAVFNGGSDPAYLAWFETEMGELRAAAEWFERDPEGVDAGLQLAVAPTWVWFVRGRFPEGRRWLETALRRGAEATPLHRGRALAALALLAFSEGDVRAQREAAEAAVGLLRGLDAPGSLVMALATFGQALSMGGDHERARPVLEEAVELARSAERQELVPALAFRGSGAAIAGESGVALVCWREACDRARARGLSHSEPHLTEGLGRLAFAEGDERTARDCFRRTLEIEVADPWCHALALQSAAGIALMEGDAVGAAELLGTAASLRARIGAPPRPEEREFLEELAARCVAEAGEAAFEDARRRGAEDDPGTALRRARGLARRSTDGASRLQAAASPGSPSMPHPASSSISPPASSQPAPARSGSTREGPAHPLAVSALGPMEIRLHGETLEPGSWSHAKPRELLVYLLCFREGRTRDQIGLHFWPDASAAQMKNSFHVLLHKLRKALGSPDAVVLHGDRYRISPDFDVWFDVDVFERVMDGALRAIADERTDDGGLERALDLYRGRFMEGEPAGDWHLEVQDRLSRLYAEGLSALADRRMEEGDLEGAVETLERLVLAEDLREDAYRRLMICLARTGRRDRALVVYRRLATLLADELEAEPEDETAALATKIRESVAV